MTTRHQPSAHEGAIPDAKVSRKRKLTIIWLVPLVAGLIAAWLVYQNLRQTGPTITIRFSNGSGLLAGNTVVRYRGVSVGEVKDVQLTKDAGAVLATVKLNHSVANFAREGTSFWVVRADFALGSLHGLDTLVGGPYIQAQPGQGAKKRDFVGLEQGPVVAVKDGGLDITLTWPQLGWLNAGAPLYYRGVEVGVVQDYSLGDRATNIVIHAHILPQYAPLVRADSEFWNAGGIKADLGLLGVSVSAESLKSLLVGGIAFATPSPPGPPPAKDMVFNLNEKAEGKWLKWSPTIQLDIPSNAPPLSADGGAKSMTPALSTSGIGR